MACGCGGTCGCGGGTTASAQALELTATPVDLAPLLGRIESLEAAIRALGEFRFFSKQEREQDAKSGAALPDGSFPIEDEEDLMNAIHLVHMANNEGIAKSHIRARASVLGLESKIPKDW